jgi:hypothetical protein
VFELHQAGLLLRGSVLVELGKSNEEKLFSCKLFCHDVQSHLLVDMVGFNVPMFETLSPSVIKLTPHNYF